MRNVGTIIDVEILHSFELRSCTKLDNIRCQRTQDSTFARGMCGVFFSIAKKVDSDKNR